MKKGPGKPGPLNSTASGRLGPRPQRQVVGLQDRQHRLEEAPRPAVGLLALAAAATSGQHALRLTYPRDEGAARVAAFGAGGGAGEVEDGFAVL